MYIYIYIGAYIHTNKYRFCLLSYIGLAGGVSESLVELLKLHT